MAKIQEKLKQTMEKQSMTCIYRLAKALGTAPLSAADADPTDAALRQSSVATATDNDTMELDNNHSSSNNNNKNAIDACDSMTPQVAIVPDADDADAADAAVAGDARLFKGENKAVIRGKKWKRNKLALVSARQKQQQQAAAGSSSSSSGRPKPRFFCKF
jgi:nitric oxide reductase activation protein